MKIVKPGVKVSEKRAEELRRILLDLGILERELKPGEKLTIDNFHLVALSDEVEWSVRAFGGLKSFFFGGEGFVVDVEGPGRVYLQTRTLPELAQLIRRFIGKGSKGFSISKEFTISL